MSQQVEHVTEIRDEACLLFALQDMGFTRGQIEVHKTPQLIHGWHGSSDFRYHADGTRMTAEVIIRRQHVGGSANDIGFARQKNGTYNALISVNEEGRDGQGRYGQDWRDRLAQNYAMHITERAYRRKGWSVSRTLTRDEKGRPLVLLTARR